MNRLGDANGLRALRPYLRKRSAPVPGEACELCGAPTDEEHAHVVDLDRRSLRCACRACALLFDNPDGRFRRVPDRVLHLPPVAAARWAEIGVPVRLAFVFFNSRLGRWYASYPSPGGAIESEVAPERWADRSRDLPPLREMEPDVEALLAWGPMGCPDLECFVVPVDACYELVALCRTHWRGFEGGDEVRAELDRFFGKLRTRADNR